MTHDRRFVRLHVTYRGVLGVEVGIFVAVDHLRRADRLSTDDERRYFDIDDWFRTGLPNPTFYADGNTVGAVTWFKTAATADMLERLEPLCDILDRHAVAWLRTDTDDPGEIIYEDEFQVGAIPRLRLEPTPLPANVILGPTTPGSKRHLGKQPEP